MSYEYLNKNAVSVKLSKEINRIDDLEVELNADQHQRASRLHNDSLVIDLHNHLTVIPENMHDFEVYARSGRPATGFEGIKASGLTACFYGFGGSAGRRFSPTPWQLDDIIWDLGIRFADIEHHSEVVMRAFCVEDILVAKKLGKTAILATIENGQMIDNDLDRIDMLYGLGVRCLGLSYNTRTTLADGCTERTDAGLSSFGLKAVERMNRIGMLIDLSHSSYLTSKETVEVSDSPCCFSHTFAQSIHDNPRGKNDEILTLLAQRGGVIGVVAVPNLISNKRVQTIFDVLDHVDYLVKLVGVNHVAIGTDAMFGDHVGLHKHIRGVMDMGKALKDLPATHVEYIEHPGQWPNITRALVARGYSDDDIKKILGENILRLLKETIG